VWRRSLRGCAYANMRATRPSSTSRSPFVFTRPIDYLTAAGFMGLAWAIWGLISGSLFTALLGIAEQRQNVDTIRMGRATAWGGLAGAFLPIISGGAVLIGTVATVVPGAVLGGACAVATLALARSSVAQHPSKLNA
jgi:hypothetical protein